MTDKLLEQMKKVSEENTDSNDIKEYSVRLIIYTNPFTVSGMSEQEVRDRLLEDPNLAKTYIEEQGIDQVEVEMNIKGGDPEGWIKSESAETIKKYKDLAEKLFVVKHLKEQKNLTEKQKKFIEETEKIELTDKERARVMSFYGKLVPKKD